MVMDNPTAKRITLDILFAVASQEGRQISDRTSTALAVYKVEKRVSKRIMSMFPEGFPTEAVEATAGKLGSHLVGCHLTAAADRKEVGVFHQKAPGQYRDFEPFRSWGHFTRYLEIGDDLHPTRHVDVYENGNMLRYDRHHLADDFGILADMKHSKRWGKWWGPSIEIDQAEFEEAWQAATASPTRQEQIDTAQMLRLGADPIWLRHKGG